MSIWVGIAVAVVLLTLGLLGLGVGLLLVLQQLRRRQVNQTHRARKIAEIKQLPHRSTRLIPASQRPTMPLITAQQQGHVSSPTLAPEEDQDVPTAVFRPSQYKDIEALLRDADKYVEKHKKN